MNKPILWLAVGGAALTATATVLFLRKRTAEGGSPPLPPTPPIYGETTRVTIAVPASWRRVTSAEVAALPELGARANAVRSAAGFSSSLYGTLTPFVASDGKTYATLIEQHWHEPGGALQPWGLHHGVTILARVGVPGALLDEWGPGLVA